MKRIVHAAALLLIAALALIATPALAETAVLAASLSGPGGTGSFRAEVDPALGDVCYVLTLSGTVKATAAQLRSAAADAKPGALVSFEVTGANTDQCMAAEPDVLKPIVANPGGYFITVPSAEHPEGALRGTLAKP
jgi:CHRD domain